MPFSPLAPCFALSLDHFWSRVGAQRPEPGDRRPQRDHAFLGPRARDRARHGPTISPPLRVQVGFCQGSESVKGASQANRCLFVLSPALAR